MKKQTNYNLNYSDLLAFLAESVTPFHAVAKLSKLLTNADFEKLDDSTAWQDKVKPNHRYYLTRNDSSIIAWKMGALKTGARETAASKKGSSLDTAVHIIGAHTDSPCLKIKPNADIHSEYFQLGVEVYGGALLNPWFDRDLSIAGRVSGLDKKQQRFDTLIDFTKPIASIPSLAIHLDRDVNKNRSINAQEHLPLLLSTNIDSERNFKNLLLQQLDKSVNAHEILDYELSCYDTQPPQIIGLDEEFIASARLDNLLSTFIGLQALLNSSDEHTSMFVSNDHEEIGSASACGAQGPFLSSVLEKLYGNSMHATIQQSRLISVDNAHAIHPNYRDKHDAQHAPIINQGPVIKINANQRYASNSVTAADFRHLCVQQNIPVQSFVTRSDMGCGSTIGPITATELGIATLDIGVPQLAMHSIRELAGLRDCDYLLGALTAFLNRKH